MRVATETGELGLFCTSDVEVPQVRVRARFTLMRDTLQLESLTAPTDLPYTTQWRWYRIR
jgi:hypothetical protein